jgi:hypothetical protein
MNKSIFILAIVIVMIAFVSLPAGQKQMEAIWQIEMVIEDGRTVTGYVLRNIDPRDLAGNGGQITITSNNPDTLQRMLDSFGIESL